MRRNVVTKVCNFSRFVADRAFHTCAAFVGRGGIATPTSLVTFFKESNASAAWQKGLVLIPNQKFLTGLGFSLGKV